MPQTTTKNRARYSLSELTAPYRCPNCNKSFAIDQPCSRFSVCLACNKVCVEHPSTLEFIRFEDWTQHARERQWAFGGVA